MRVMLASKTKGCARCEMLEKRLAELEAILAFGQLSSYEKALVFREDKKARMTGPQIAVKHGMVPKSRGYVNNCLGALQSHPKVVEAWKNGRIPDNKMFALNVHRSDPDRQLQLARAYLTQTDR